MFDDNLQKISDSENSYTTISSLFDPGPQDIEAALLEGSQANGAGASNTLRSSVDSQLSSLLDSVFPENKTLLENYWYNFFMTVFQDLPQSMVTVIVMTHGGLKNEPDNPTGVSLPGNLNLIPQFGNTIAGLAAAHEAFRLIRLCRHDFSSDKAFYAALYSIFALSTVINGITNTVSILSNKSCDEADMISSLSTFIALLANFILLCREEVKLFGDLCSRDNEGKKFNQKLFHLVCSVNLNVSIITSFLVTSGNISLTLGACGYLFGTWLGQVPELIEPTMERLGF